MTSPESFPWPGRSDYGLGTMRFYHKNDAKSNRDACCGRALFHQRQHRLVADRLAGKGAQRAAVQVVARVLEDEPRVDPPARLAGLDGGPRHSGRHLRGTPEVERLRHEIVG